MNRRRRKKLDRATTSADEVSAGEVSASPSEVSKTSAEVADEQLYWCCGYECDAIVAGSRGRQVHLRTAHPDAFGMLFIPLPEDKQRDQETERTRK